MDDRSGLQEFTMVCCQYESRPTKVLYEYLLDIVQDPDIDPLARLRGFMALKGHHPREVSIIGLNIIRYYLKYPGELIGIVGVSGYFKQLMCYSLARDDGYLGELDAGFVRNVFREMTLQDAYETVRDCCRPSDDIYVAYLVSPNHERVLLQVGLHYTPPNKKLDVAYISHQRGALTVECCDHLYNFRREIGDNLWDFFHELEGHAFTRYRLMGQQFIARGGGGQEEQMLGNQNVHKLDKYRLSFLNWLCKKTFPMEDEQHQYAVDNLMDIFFSNGKYIQVLGHIKGLTSVFEFPYEETVQTIEKGRVVENKIIRDLRWTLYTVLRRMVWFIGCHPHRSELQKRLGEELNEMQGTCVSGHLNRIFNCLIGFEDILQISLENDYKHRLREELDKLGADEEELIDAIIMAEWNAKTRKRCVVVSNVARETTWKLLEGHLNGDSAKLSKEDPDEAKWFYDTVFKWSGLKLENIDEDEIEDEKEDDSEDEKEDDSEDEKEGEIEVKTEEEKKRTE